MRDVNRIKPTLDVFAEIQEVRGLTIAQIFTALQEDAGWDLFYMEEDKLCEYAREFFDIKGEGGYKWTLVLDVIEDVWRGVPDWRFSQLLCNLRVTDGLSDETLALLLDRYFLG